MDPSTVVIACSAQGHVMHLNCIGVTIWTGPYYIYSLTCLTTVIIYKDSLVRNFP